jgi:hypothetical protein
MVADDLPNRITVVEQKMAGLDALPNRLESVEVRLTGVEGRLTGVEDRLTGVEGRLIGVDGRLTSVESQIVQLRGEMNDGFSALRVEMHDGSRELAEMIDERFIRQDLEMRRLNGETNAQMRALYEDLKDTIKRIGEAPPS